MITRNRSDRRSPPTRRGLSQLDRGAGRIAPSHALLTGLGASCASGVALAIAFPPVGAWPIAFLALVPLLWAIRGATPSRAALFGFASGVSAFGLLLSWIIRFGEAAFVSLVLLLALFTVAFALMARILLRGPWRTLRVAGVAAAWTLIEHVRGVWPLGGFTWGGLGVSQVDDPFLLPLASIAGSIGITFVVVVVNVLALEFLVDRRRSWHRYKALVVVTVVILAPTAIPLAATTGTPLDVVSLQVDVRTADADSRSSEDLEVARLHIGLHGRLVDRDRPDLVIWGEGALDPAATSDPLTMSAVRQVIREVGAPTIVGAAPTDAAGQRTSALMFDGAGHEVDRYDKTHLVPFGEYVPWRRRLSWFDAVSQIPVDRVPGERIEPLVDHALPAIGTPICFENAFPSLVRDMVKNGAELLVVPVNNASYGFSAASEQHLQMSRMRAVEADRWVVNAGVSGITAAIDPTGRVVERTQLFETTSLRTSVFAIDSRTPFVRWGDWMVWLSFLLLAASWGMAFRRHPVARRYPRGV